jgi:serine/threonine protein kinase
VKALAGNYRAIAELGCGRLATAWLAEQVGAEGRRVFIRVLKPANGQHRLALTRLRREIATLALLSHPSVATIHECEQARDGRLYVVSECPEGPSVAGWLVGHGAFPLRDVLEVAGQCARILHIGQQLGIRNRGLRLDSVFIARDASGGWRVKLRDFGLPAALDLSALADGSADSNDLAEPTDSDTSAHDVSALGLAVYAMLTGDPWPGRTGGPLRPVSSIRPDVPTTLDTILWASLDTAARVSYQSATELWSVLRDTLIEDAEGEDDVATRTPARAVLHRQPAIETDTTRRRLGELMLAEGVISPTQLRAALRQQARWADVPLGQILMERGWISREQLLSLLERYKRKYRLGDLLVETNNITEEQLAIALQEQQKSGLRLGELLVQLEYVSERGMRQALCKQLGIGFVEFDEVSLDRAMARVIPSELARHHRALPIARDGDRLTVALEDPTNGDAVAELERLTGCNIEVVTGERASFRRAFSALYHRAADPSVEPTAPGPDRYPSAAPAEQATNHTRRQPERASGVQGEGSVQQEEIEATLIRLQSQYAALLQKHEAAIQAFRKQEEHYESLLRERQDIAEGLARLAEQFRS